MRLIKVILAINFVIYTSNSQSLPSNYQIDGNITITEYGDSTALKKVLTTETFAIKESDSFYYIGVFSNTYTIANLYITTESSIKIMHASAAIGEINFIRSDNDWIKDRKKWIWRHRDTKYWDKQHPEPLQDQDAFYKEFGWFANTMSKGSFREWEFIVSKKILPKIEQLGITFYYKNEQVQLVNEPSWFNGITSEYTTNVKIHMGDIPEKLKF